MSWFLKRTARHAARLTNERTVCSDDRGSTGSEARGVVRLQLSESARDGTDAAYAQCATITGSQARTFWHEIRLLPPVKRRALSAAYPSRAGDWCGVCSPLLSMLDRRSATCWGVIAGIYVRPL
jgi:hypothetical protein